MVFSFWSCDHGASVKKLWTEKLRWSNVAKVEVSKSNTEKSGSLKHDHRTESTPLTAFKRSRASPNWLLLPGHDWKGTCQPPRWLKLSSLWFRSLKKGLPMLTRRGQTCRRWSAMPPVCSQACTWAGWSRCPDPGWPTASEASTPRSR